MTAATQTELDIRRRYEPGYNWMIDDARKEDVAHLLALLDRERAQKEQAQAMLREIARCPVPLAMGWQPRVAAFLREQGAEAA